jgi:hypothetical protein
VEKYSVVVINREHKENKLYVVLSRPGAEKVLPGFREVP